MRDGNSRTIPERLKEHQDWRCNKLRTMTTGICCLDRLLVAALKKIFSRTRSSHGKNKRGKNWGVLVRFGLELSPSQLLFLATIRIHGSLTN